MVDLWRLTPLSTKCQLYRGDQFFWWWKSEYLEVVKRKFLYLYYYYPICRARYRNGTYFLLQDITFVSWVFFLCGGSMVFNYIKLD
jgi:hypothetical protein